jgi:hypothetical protein
MCVWKYDLEKFKNLYLPNPHSDIVATSTWRWHAIGRNLTWVWTLRFLQIGSYMCLKIWPWKIQKPTFAKPSVWYCHNFAMMMTWRLPQSHISVVTQILTDRQLLLFENMTLKNSKAFICQTLCVILSQLWLDDDMSLAAVRLEYGHTGSYRSTVICVWKYDLEKFKGFHLPNPQCDIVVTFTWRLLILELNLTLVWSLRFLKIGSYMCLKIWPSKIQRPSFAKPSVWYCRNFDKMMTCHWPQSVLSMDTQVLTDRQLYVFEYMTFKNSKTFICRTVSVIIL